MFTFDSTGIDPDVRGGGSKQLPKRWFDLEVIEFVSKDGKEYPLYGKTKNGDPKVDCLVKVINDPEFSDERIFHTVSFLPKDNKGAGMAIHFLKTIGQPWEGKFSVVPKNWVGRQFKGYIVQDEYLGKTKNKIGEIKPISDVKEDIPF